MVGAQMRNHGHPSQFWRWLRGQPQQSLLPRIQIDLRKGLEKLALAEPVTVKAPRAITPISDDDEGGLVENNLGQAEGWGRVGRQGGGSGSRRCSRRWRCGRTAAARLIREPRPLAKAAFPLQSW